MLLTFPLPFFTCRELVVVFLTELSEPNTNNQDLEEPLLVTNESFAEVEERLQPLLSNSFDLSVLSSHAMRAVHSILLHGYDRQLKLPYHIIATVKLWFVVTGLAVTAPSLGDVLDLVGCASGAVIAFVFPGLVSLRLEGYSHTAALILLIGCVVGFVGTFFSLKKMIEGIGL